MAGTTETSINHVCMNISWH